MTITYFAGKLGRKVFPVNSRNVHYAFLCSYESKLLPATFPFCIRNEGTFTVTFTLKMNFLARFLLNNLYPVE